MIDTTKDFRAAATIDSPMGPIKGVFTVCWKDATHFSGEVKLVGFTNPYDGGVRTGDNYVLDLSVRVPFGTLNIHIDATIDASGNIAGVATMPHRKPMRLSGNINQ